MRNGMAQVANETGLSRGLLYRSFSEKQPGLEITPRLMKALCFGLSVKASPFLGWVRSYRETGVARRRLPSHQADEHTFTM
ncbi:MAG: hypothetical protein IPK59_05160 [Rhodospirillaceae bacterium]|nr:hypothetical protein [Rhodospirillaceae bacterium]